MTMPDPRTQVAQAIEDAIADLADALVELDSIPAHDQSTVGFVAHAMNNYLSVTDGTLALLRQALRDYPDRDVANWLEGLRHLGSMMQHTVGRLVRTTGTDDTDDFPLKPDYMNLPRLMERACDHYRVKADQKQLQIICRAVGDIPLTWGDAVGVAIVADNLLSNAVKFSNAGGDILVQILPGPGGVVASVRDYGPGLTFLEQARLFQNSVLADPSATPALQTTGYGIKIAKGLIDRMGGRLWAESEPGRGACFFFRLPYHPKKPAESGEVESRS
jgi:signal transduction histidine kinase